MKKSELRQLIKEEIQKILKEEDLKLTDAANPDSEFSEVVDILFSSNPDEKFLKKYANKFGKVEFLDAIIKNIKAVDEDSNEDPKETLKTIKRAKQLYNSYIN